MITQRGISYIENKQQEKNRKRDAYLYKHSLVGPCDGKQ